MVAFVLAGNVFLKVKKEKLISKESLSLNRNHDFIHCVSVCFECAGSAGLCI